MGYSILELVLWRLREENFKADVAYPGQKYPPIRNPAAAVHIQQVDRDNMTVTIEVSILCPAEMGGTTCETEALRATEVLRRVGATCIQHGCDYDGMAQVYCVSILATFTGITEEGDCTLGPGFEVYIDDVSIPYATAFTSEKTADWETRYAIGTGEPIGTAGGRVSWQITLTERIPHGSNEVADNPGEFQLRVEKANHGRETYLACHWTKVTRQFTQAGILRTRVGLATGLEVL